jgi:hypothetical protein
MQRVTDIHRVRRFLVRSRLSPNGSRTVIETGDATWDDRWWEPPAPDPRATAALLAGGPVRGTEDEWRGDEVPMRLDVLDGPDGPEEVAAVVDVLDGKWVLRALVHPDTGEIHEFTVKARDPHDAVTRTRAMRLVGFGAVEDQFRKWLADPVVGERLGPRWAQTSRRPGRAGRDDVHYAQWSELYVAALEASPRSPVRHIVQEVAAGRIQPPGDGDRSHVTDAEVRWYLSEARRRGLLTPAPRGRPGGELTPAATALLADLRAAQADAVMSTSERPKKKKQATSRTRKKAK